MTDVSKSITIALAWCLAWGEQRQPQFQTDVLQQMRQALETGKEVPQEVRSLVEQVQQLQAIPKDYFPEKITQLRDKYPALWQQTTRIGLVYGGATKIKGYVFESAKLQDIRGASALLDRINIVDLKAFFGEPKKSPSTSDWLAKYFPGLEAALIPELIIYSTGGNVLAFCPSAYVHDLANAIERRYTEETLTANSCAVGDTFKLLETRFGLLYDSIEQTKWLDWYLSKPTREHPLVESYFGKPESGQDWADLFKNRKSFSELAGKLAALFNKRRSGNDLPNAERPSRCYPPMFETHPYLVRDESDRRNAVVQARNLPGEPRFSESLARKRLMGQITKREVPQGQLPQWYKDTEFDWQPGEIESWVYKFELFLLRSERWRQYYADFTNAGIKEAQTLAEIGNASNDFVAYIYADGNNMGGYIQKIKTSQEYQQFSKDISQATEEAVYEALHQHLKPHQLKGLTGQESQNRNGIIIHPFEILTIGGDDVFLIVPANKALAIAKTIGEEFERILLEKKNEGNKIYKISEAKQNSKSVDYQRYQGKNTQPLECQLSMSIGVLITASNTPIYYARDLTEQLLKSAKACAKELKAQNHYYGGTVDFLVMKSVTMISSKISSFRQEGLTKAIKENQTLKLYAAPYTLHELGGLLDTAQALKKSGFPRSQLYQIRSLLEQGKNTAILNYRYFRIRLGKKEQKLLEEYFESAWCAAKTNNGNLAPWMSVEPEKKQKQTPEKITYETIWRELVDLYPFIEAETTEVTTKDSTVAEVNL